MTTALDVSRYLLYLKHRDHKHMTGMKIIKLVYFCQAWWLAYNNSSLFEEDIQAWKWGPSIKSLYDHYKKYGDRGIWTDETIYNGQLTKKEEDLIESVWNTYKEYHPYNLMDMTHAEGTPWQSVYNGDFDTIIPKDSIRKYYRENWNIPEPVDDEVFQD